MTSMRESYIKYMVKYQHVVQAVQANVKHKECLDIINGWKKDEKCVFTKKKNEHDMKSHTIEGYMIKKSNIKFFVGNQGQNLSSKSEKIFFYYILLNE